MKRSKRYRAIAEKIDPDRKYETDEAVGLVKECGNTQFDQTVELTLKLGINPKLADQMIRGSVSLPHGVGRTVRVVVFCQGDDIEAAKQAGALEAGADELVEKVNSGWMDFDVAIAHPSVMPKVGRLGRVLGPKGLMPSPKSGTVATDIATATQEFIAGKIEFRNDPAGVIHAPVGKISFPKEHLVENVQAFVDRIRSMKPASSKGIFIQKVVLSATMAPGLQLNIS